MGIANNDERLSGAVAVVRNPAADSLATSAGVKAVLATVEDVGLALIMYKYLAILKSVESNMEVLHGQLTLKVTT